jgi:hypothetical protein
MAEESPAAGPSLQGTAKGESGCVAAAEGSAAGKFRVELLAALDFRGARSRGHSEAGYHGG